MIQVLGLLCYGLVSLFSALSCPSVLPTLNGIKEYPLHLLFLSSGIGFANCQLAACRFGSYQGGISSHCTPAACRIPVNHYEAFMARISFPAYLPLIPVLPNSQNGSAQWGRDISDTAQLLFLLHTGYTAVLFLSSKNTRPLRSTGL